MPGGWRQHLGHNDARSRSPQREIGSEQLREWLRQWAWGKASAADVIRHARSAEREGHDDALLRRLLKSAGNIQNAQRAIERCLPSNLIPITAVPDSCLSEVLLPKDVFKWMQQSNPVKFKHHLGANNGGVQTFWEGLLASPTGPDFWLTHPWLNGRTPSDLKYHVPLVLHDDAGPISKHTSAFVRNWFSILGKGGETETRS